MTIENAAPHNITFAFRSNDAYAATEPAATSREEYEARFAQRGIARVIDTVVAVLLAVGAQIVLVGPLSHYGPVAWIAASLLSVLVPNSLEFLMLAASGQSIGKRVAKIRVVRNTDNGPLGLGRAFLRTYTPAALFFLTSTALIEMGVDPGARLLVAMALNGIQLVLLWSERGRMIPDRVAGTRVIETNCLDF